MSNTILHVRDPGNAKLATDMMGCSPTLAPTGGEREGILCNSFALVRCEWGADKPSEALFLAKLSSGPSGQAFADRARALALRSRSRSHGARPRSSMRHSRNRNVGRRVPSASWVDSCSTQNRGWNRSTNLPAFGPPVDARSAIRPPEIECGDMKRALAAMAVSPGRPCCRPNKVVVARTRIRNVLVRSWAGAPHLIDRAGRLV
jgi:hypothetical protein